MTTPVSLIGINVKMKVCMGFDIGTVNGLRPQMWTPTEVVRFYEQK
jgi:hypothetical protein